jgi:hypothetical protein
MKYGEASAHVGGIEESTMEQYRIDGCRRDDTI